MDGRLLATYERLLSDPDSAVRLDAAAGLARSDVEAGVKAYLGLSTDPDSSVALLAADGLARLGRRQLAADACLLVADRNPDSMLAAAARLADLGRTGLARDLYALDLDSLPADLTLTASDALRLLDFPEPARAGYLRVVLAGQPEQVLAAAAALESLGDPSGALSAYVKLVDDDRFAEQILAAAQRLDAADGQVDTWPLYRGLLDNENTPATAKLAAAELLSLRRWPVPPDKVVASGWAWASFSAARMLERTQPGHPLIQEVWTRYAEAHDLDLALAVADRLLAADHQPLATQVYTRGLKSSSAAQVLAAVRGMRRIRPDAAANTLEELATDSDPSVAVEAALLLDPANPEDLQLLERLVTGPEEVAVEAAERLASGPANLLAEENLLTLRGSSHEAVRMRIGALLEGQGLTGLAVAEYATVTSPEFAPLVLEAGRRLQDADDAKDAAALYAAALPLLPSDADRDEASARLHLFDPDKARELNRALLQAERPSARSLHTVARLEVMGDTDSAKAEYRQLAGHRDRQLAVQAAHFLLTYDKNAARASFQRLADGDDAIALTAAQRLAQLGDVAYVWGVVDQLLSSPYSAVALGAADLLHGLPPQEPAPKTAPPEPEAEEPPAAVPIAAMADVRLGLRPFISYSRAHADDAADLDAALRQRGLDPWIDFREVLPGTSLVAAVGDGVRQSTSLVVLVSVSSPQEQLYHWELAAAQGRPIVPVLTGSPVPVPLSGLHGIRFEGDVGALADTLYELSGVALDAPQPPPELITALEAGEVVVFTGVDLAARAGYPTRRQHVTDLLDWFERSAPAPADPGLLQSLQAGLRLGEVDAVGDALAGMLDAATFQEQVERAFGQDRDFPDAYRLVANLQVAGAMTCNYDTLLERSFPGADVLTTEDAERVLDSLSRRDRFVLKLYGRIDQPETLVRSFSHFQQLRTERVDVAQALEGILSSWTVLFLGAGMGEITDLLQTLRAQTPNRRHYAVMHVDQPTWRVQAEQLLRRFGVQVLPYNGLRHEQLDAFVGSLGRQASRSTGPAADGQSESLTKLTLDNIGPYGHMEIDLSRHWNVVLGDNGVGKSSVLKAIAFVYAGEAAGPAYGERLLRVGASHGSIRIDTSTGRFFVTELVRATSGVQVRHGPAVKLEAESQLVIALPSLRAMSWRRESSPTVSETPRRPSPSDLLPLLSGDPDPRIDGVKQRIINADYLMKDAQAKGGDAPAHEALKIDLVRAVRTLTVELGIHDLEVDPKANAVIAVTVDGRVPIEALSQGTTSIIGWVGAVIQRLHDTADGSTPPLERDAIVLVDELDAHMHPGWQQLLVERLGELFPNIQFIATTHSPLIVSGMPVEQVTVFRRDESGQVVKVPLPEDGTIGRADQLLTSRLFGLHSTLDGLTRAAVFDYQKLLLQESRTPQEEVEMSRLRHLLDVRVPVAATSTAEQRAQEMLDLLLRESVGTDFPEMRQQLLAQAAELLDEAARLKAQA